MGKIQGSQIRYGIPTAEDGILGTFLPGNSHLLTSQVTELALGAQGLPWGEVPAGLEDAALGHRPTFAGDGRTLISWEPPFFLLPPPRPGARLS